MPRMPRPLRCWLRGIVILVAWFETAHRDRHPLLPLRQLPAGLGILPRRRHRARSPTSTPIPTARSSSSPVERDPQGNIDRYAAGCARTSCATASARHIIGCVTSWSRKEVIPVLEKAGGTLWYACPYEGFEANEHVVYMHACPNQHLVPLLGYVVPRFGANGFLLGSNYIWGWETNRVARDLIADAGGKVLGERYLPHRRDRRVAADRRDPGDAAGLHPQQSDRPVVLRLPRGLCRAWPRAIRISGRNAARSCPAISPSASCRRSAKPATGICRSGRIFATRPPASCRPRPGGGRLCLGAGAGRNPGAQSRRRAGPTCPRPSPSATFRTPLGPTSPSTRRPSTRPCRCMIGRIERRLLQDGQPDQRASRPTPICRATTAPRSSAARA